MLTESDIQRLLGAGFSNVNIEGVAAVFKGPSLFPRAGPRGHNGKRFSCIPLRTRKSGR
jgi:hypothetical protein